MTNRQLRNLFSAIFFVAFALVAGGTSGPEQTPIGTYPLGFEVHGDTAWLLYYHLGPETDSGPQASRLGFTTFDSRGARTTLHRVDVPPVAPFDVYWGAVTADAVGAFGFALTPAEQGKARTIVFSGGKTKPVVRTQNWWSEGRIDHARLSMVRRDANRYWAWFSQGAVQSAYHFPPLWEIADMTPGILAESTIWAACNDDLCQQVRYVTTPYEMFHLRLYAYPATADEPRLVVKEKTAGRGYYPSRTTGGTPLLVVGSNRYRLSATQPVLAPSGSSKSMRPPKTDRFSGKFADGITIEVSTEFTHDPRESFCDSKCREYHRVTDTWITLRAADGTELQSFPLGNH